MPALRSEDRSFAWPVPGGDDERYWVPDTILATAELYCPASANCPPDPWELAIAAVKTAAGTDHLNFYQ